MKGSFNAYDFASAICLGEGRASAEGEPGEDRGISANGLNSAKGVHD